MVFSSKENENFLRQHCLPFQYAPLCTIGDHLNKLCHECGHKIDHLAWKPLISIRDSSFLRTLFKNNCRITSLLFFLGTWPHMMTQCEGFPIFWFFWCFYARFKMRSKRWEWPFLASGWILEFCWCFSDKKDTYVPRNDFWKKIKSKLRGSYSSNLTHFQLNRR